MRPTASLKKVKCPECSFTSHKHWLRYDEPETFQCPKCRVDSRKWWQKLLGIGIKAKIVMLSSGAKRREPCLRDGFSGDVNSELFVRPDKDHPGREMLWGWNKLQKLADKGRTRPIQKREMQMVKDRMAHYNRDYGEVKI